MNELKALLMLELRSLWGINRFRHTQDPRAKRRYRLLTGVWVFLILMAAGYATALVWGLCALGMPQIVPAYLALLASALILAVGLFQAGNHIFGRRGYDILASLPLKTGNLVLSRMLSLYLQDLVIALVILAPGLTAYGLLAHPRALFWLLAPVGAVFVPAIPLVISTLLGTGILAVSSRMKHKNLVETVLAVALVILVLIASFSMPEEDFDPARLAALAGSLGQLIGKFYPPALWLGDALAQGRAGLLLLFAGCSAGILALTAALVTRCFHPIATRLGAVTARQTYRMGELSSRGLLRALYIREAKRYFSSSIYVTNTIIGPIMGVLLAGGIAFGGLDAIRAELPFDIRAFLPWLLGGVMCMMTTTACSVSLEGREFWAIRSLPIPAKAWLDAKLLVNLTLLGPAWLLAQLLLQIGLVPGPGERVRLLLVPLSLMLFSVVFGITADLKLHRFDWETEAQIVKQGAAAMLGGFAGPLAAIVLGTAGTLAPWTTLPGCAALLAVTALLYRKNCQTDMAVL